ncbi:gephyrin-like molybdotransferase Glp [Candidatus Latescibacterota bacterium]
MITPEAAFNSILNNIHPLHEIFVPLIESTGYTLAEEIFADRDSPAADRSAMDGYAVSHEDLAHCPRTLNLTGEVSAGSPEKPEVLPGTCVRVLTGANVPPGADTVVRVEDTEKSDDSVVFLKTIKSGSNIRRQGEEVKKGDLLFTRGTILGAAQIGICATVGKAELNVYYRPRIAVVCTGEELRDAAEPVKVHEIRDSNGPSLRATLFTWGFTDITQKTLPDDVEVIEKELSQLAESHEVILITGGVSVGTYDFVPEAVEQIGATIQFHKVFMKPGKPFLYATLPGNRHIFGLPGNPLSVMAGFYEFVLPGLHRLSGRVEKDCRISMFLPLSHSVSSDKERVRLVIAQIQWNSNGPEVTPLKSHGSADLPAGSKADGVIVVPVNAGEITAGTLVEFRPWRPLP